MGRGLGPLVVPRDNMGEPDSLRARAPLKPKVIGEANFSPGREYLHLSVKNFKKAMVPWWRLNGMA